MIRVKTFGGSEEPWHGQHQRVWVDACQPNPAELAELQQVFRMNPLALEDAFEQGHWSRFETYPEHDFLILRTFAEPEACGDRSERASIFYYHGADALLTITNEAVNYLDRVWGLVGREHVNSPAEVAYELADSAADTFFTFVDALGEQIEGLEEQMVQSRGDTEVVRTIFAYKHRVMAARRLVSAARDAIGMLARHGQLEGMDAVRFRDVWDSLTRVTDSLDSAREVLSSILDVHLSVQSNRLNEVMRTLTAVSTVFLPLTFLAGVWGMNFSGMPELHWKYGYLFAWACFVVIALVMVRYFRKRGWW